METKILGKGNTAEVFEYGVSKVCKLFHEGFPAVVIDFMNACRGRWEYDVARTYFLLNILR